MRSTRRRQALLAGPWRLSPGCVDACEIALLPSGPLFGRRQRHGYVASVAILRRRMAENNYKKILNRGHALSVYGRHVGQSRSTKDVWK